MDILIKGRTSTAGASHVNNEVEEPGVLQKTCPYVGDLEQSK